VVNRRQFVNRLVAAGIFPIPAVAGLSRVVEFPPTRVITKGPRHHWFGYYDKLQFDPSGRFVLGDAGAVRASIADERRCDRDRNGGSARQRSMDSTGAVYRMELAAGLYAAVAAGIEIHSPLE
jgi:hypothetical protein